MAHGACNGCGSAFEECECGANRGMPEDYLARTFTELKIQSARFLFLREYGDIPRSWRVEAVFLDGIYVTAAGETPAEALYEAEQLHQLRVRVIRLGNR